MRAIISFFMGLGVLGWSAGTLAANRIALVIGNAQYQAAPALRNPANDARDIAAKLRSLDFQLVGGGPQLNVGRAQMARLIRDFGNAAQPGDVALFYFAGHGVAGNNDNWLLPVDDGDIKVQEDVPDFAVSARSVLARMEQRGSGVNLVLLDACRNNPLPDRRRSVGGTRGLARMVAPLGSFIAYAASPGQAAADGNGRNGLFTGILLSLIDQPGLRIDDLFAQVGRRVREASGGEQLPIRETNLEDVFYFRPGELPQAGLSRPPPVSAPAASYAPPPVAVTNSGYSTSGGLLKPASLGGLASGTVFRDCEDCPEMIRVPMGRFDMGSPGHEADRESDEGPVHEVSIAYPLAVGKFEVTRGQWRQFLSESGKSYGNGCGVWDLGQENWVLQADRSWRDPGYAQDDSHPVVCVNWQWAKDYVAWLSGKTGKKYRLMSEAEFEYVNRAGGTTAYPWGSAVEEHCLHANAADQRAKAKSSPWAVPSCDDGYAETAPVGRFQANGFGLYDVSGNVWEWMEDCWNDGYIDAPSNGAVWAAGDCSRRALRGGSWYAPPRFLRAANRGWYPAATANLNLGFRLARTD